MPYNKVFTTTPTKHSEQGSQSIHFLPTHLLKESGNTEVFWQAKSSSSSQWGMNIQALSVWVILAKLPEKKPWVEKRVSGWFVKTDWFQALCHRYRRDGGGIRELLMRITLVQVSLFWAFTTISRESSPSWSVITRGNRTLCHIWHSFQKEIKPLFHLSIRQDYRLNTNCCVNLTSLVSNVMNGF